MSTKLRGMPWMTMLLLACAALGVVYKLMHPALVEKAVVMPAGWDDLGACAFAISLDGNKDLTLSDDQEAELWDHSPGKESDRDKSVTKGNWRYDNASKRYLVSFGGQTGTYQLVKPPGGCVLLKGDLDAANLRESWFASDHSDQEDYDPRDYEPPPVRGD